MKVMCLKTSLFFLGGGGEEIRPDNIVFPLFGVLST